MKRATVNYKSF